MNIEAFMICDAATEERGKLFILGAFDTLFSQKFPATHPACTVALRMRFFREEKGDHKLEVRFLDDDANEFAPPLQANININIPNSEQSSAIHLLMNIQNVVFQHKGNYSVNLEIDGKETCVLPITVKYM